MEEMEKNIQRQIIVRLFQPDMTVLKAVTKQVSEKPGIKLGLYGQSGEVLVVIAVQAISNAAATELSERAAAFVERKLGDSAYGRGKDSLAHFVAAEMMEDECTVIAADAETGALLETEFQTTAHGEKVFDFGQASFRNKKMTAKIEKAALMDEEEPGDPVQQAADRSYAAAKCTKAEFGASIAGTEGEKAVCAAVTYRGYVYIRAIRPSVDAAKTAALTVLDMMRRLLLGVEIPYARAFKAGREVNWDVPVKKKAGKGGKKKNILVPILALVVLAAVLGVAIWFIYNTFFIKEEANLPAEGGTTTSQGAPADAGQSTVAGAATSQSAPVEGEGATAAAPPAGGQANNTGGAVKPF